MPAKKTTIMKELKMENCRCAGTWGGGGEEGGLIDGMAQQGVGGRWAKRAATTAATPRNR
eukprot:scaffold1908_cov104-Isochrysis_galbana.AAC.16